MTIAIMISMIIIVQTMATMIGGSISEVFRSAGSTNSPEQDKKKFYKETAA